MSQLGEPNMPETSKGPMTPPDWFGVGFRLFALWPLLLAIQNFLYFIDIRFGLSSSRPYASYGLMGDVDHIGYLFYSCGYALFSLGLMRAAPIIVSFAYPEESNQHIAQSTVDHEGDNSSQ